VGYTEGISMDTTEEITGRLAELSRKIESLEQTVRRSIEATSQMHVDTLVEGTRASMLASLVRHVQDDNLATLEDGMPRSCEMHERCKDKLALILRETMEVLAGEQGEDALEDKKRELSSLFASAPFEACAFCKERAEELLEKQIRLMRSMRLYKTQDQERQDISCICSDVVVTDILEPVANKQRLYMLQSLARQTMTFSALSELTGLRGGNLLFHLSKLIEKEMVIQRHERGDYMITERGYRTLVALGELASQM
jgi:DNA-binding transcriptional ArsR family regulator